MAATAKNNRATPSPRALSISNLRSYARMSRQVATRSNLRQPKSLVPPQRER